MLRVRLKYLWYMQQIKPENNIERFVEAQECRWADYDRALSEIAEGQKRSHWMWYIFPQLRGLGHSDMAYFYGISGMEEAVEYFNHPKLGPRLREIAGVLLTYAGSNIVEIMGPVDSIKLRSSMTLFYRASGYTPFATVLETFFGGEECSQTLSILAQER